MRPGDHARFLDSRKFRETWQVCVPHQCSAALAYMAEVEYAAGPALQEPRAPGQFYTGITAFNNSGNYRGIKQMCHSMKLYERVHENRLRNIVSISEEQSGFMKGKPTTDAIFALRQLQGRYREGQQDLHCVFIDLEKAYDRVPREELYWCMRDKGVPEKYIRRVNGMYHQCETVVRCAAGTSEPYAVEVGLYQGSAFSPFLLPL